MRDGVLKIEKVAAIDKDYDLIKLEGPLTLATLSEFQDVLRQDLSQRTIIDISGVPYIDSAGLGAMLSFHASCKRSGRAYAIAAMAARVYTMFAASKVDKLINLCPTLEEAEAFVSK